MRARRRRARAAACTRRCTVNAGVPSSNGSWLRSDTSARARSAAARSASSAMAPSTSGDRNALGRAGGEIGHEGFGRGHSSDGFVNREVEGRGDAARIGGAAGDRGDELRGLGGIGGKTHLGALAVGSGVVEGEGQAAERLGECCRTFGVAAGGAVFEEAKRPRRAGGRRAGPPRPSRSSRRSAR